MKRFLVIMLACAFLLGGIGIAFAELQYSRSGNTFILIETVVTTDGVASTNSTVSAANNIIGIAYTDSAAGGCAFYDSTGDATTTRRAEVLVAAGGGNTFIFPLPYDVVNGVTIATQSTGVAMIYYE